MPCPFRIELVDLSANQITEGKTYINATKLLPKTGLAGVRLVPFANIRATATAPQDIILEALKQRIYA